MSKKKENSDDEITLADTVSGQVLEGKSMESSAPEPVKVVAEGSLSDKAIKTSISQLTAEHRMDIELASLFAIVVEVLKIGVLMRKWGPPDVSVEDKWAVKQQIVVPKSYRQEILSMTHELHVSSHMDVSKKL